MDTSSDDVHGLHRRDVEVARPNSYSDRCNHRAGHETLGRIIASRNPDSTDDAASRFDCRTKKGWHHSLLLGQEKTL